MGYIAGYGEHGSFSRAADTGSLAGSGACVLALTLPPSRLRPFVGLFPVRSCFRERFPGHPAANILFPGRSWAWF